jgi:hypothetical protein
MRVSINLGLAIGIATASVSPTFGDEAADSTTAQQYPSSVEPRPFLRDDTWLNAPLSRLDYVLMNVQSRLNANLPVIVEGEARDYFEPFYNQPASVEFDARYSEEKGRIVLIGSVDTVGKPKKPMKAFCESVISWMRQSYPLKPLGYLWYDNGLGLLIRGDAKKYRDEVINLMKSAVLSATVSSSYASAGKNLFFQVGCMQQAADGPITFYKYSDNSQSHTQ